MFHISTINTKKMRTAFILFLTLFLNVTLSAQDSTPDATFNPTDIGNRNGDGPYNTIMNPYPYFNKVAVQADGKIVIGGNFDVFDTLGRNRVARLNNTAPLGVDDFTSTSSNIAVYTENNTLRIDTKETPLQSVTVYDLNGKLLYENQHVIDTNFVIESYNQPNS